MQEESLLYVARGVPNAAELAALVGVLFSRSRQAPAVAVPPASRWATSARPLGGTCRSADAWRTAALPGCRYRSGG